MANLVLDVSYEDDFMIYGIVAAVRDYKLAWGINNCLNLDLKRGEEVNLYEGQKNKKCICSCYCHETELYDFTLIQNKSMDFFQVSKPYLLPELKEYDYFLKFGGQSDIYTKEYVRKKLSNVLVITYIKEIDLDKIKEKENLLII